MHFESLASGLVALQELLIHVRIAGGGQQASDSMSWCEQMPFRTDPALIFPAIG